MVLVSSFPVWRKELLVLVTGFCWYFFIICACVWVKICQGKVQQEKSTEFCSEANETMNSYCSCKCNLDWAALKVVTSLAVSVKTGCCRKAWTRENGSSTLTKNNPRKTRFSEQEPSALYQGEDCNGKLSIAGKCLCDLCFQLYRSLR